MIVLKRIASKTVSGAKCYEIAGTLSGTLNDSNQVFTTEYGYRSGSISVLYNGQALHSPGDFLETGDNEITFIYMEPGLDDVLRANYEYKDCVSASKKGKKNVLNGVDQVIITFDEIFPSTNYVLTTSLTNIIDGANACVFPYIIGSKTTGGFTVYFQGYIDSNNYVLEWVAMGL